MGELADGWREEEKGESKDERQLRAGRAMPHAAHAIPQANCGKNQICNEQEGSGWRNKRNVRIKDGSSELGNETASNRISSVPPRAQ